MNQMTIEFGVGKELRAARLKAELKISDVAEELNLSIDHIIAIEKDNYEDLPGVTYVVGFVKSYAKLLGLNDVHLIDRLMQSGFIPSSAPIKPAIEDTEFEKIERSSVGTAFLILLLVAILATTYFYFSTKHLVEKQSAEVISEIEPVVTETLATPEKKNEEPVIVEVEVAKIKLIGTKPEGARIMLTAKQDAWFQVYNPKNKKVYLNAVLKSGHSVWLENDQDAVMDIGRPHKVLVSVDGKKYGSAGPSWGGVIKKLSIDPNFIIHDYFGKGLNDKSYNRWLRNQ